MIVAIGQLYAFGQARRAGRVELDDIIRAQCFKAGWSVILTVAPGIVGWPVTMGVINRDDVLNIRQVCPDLVDHVVEIPADKQDLHIGV